MFNIEKLEEFVEQLANEVNAIIEKKIPELKKIIGQEIPKNWKYRSCMGVALIEDENAKDHQDLWDKVESNDEATDEEKEFIARMVAFHQELTNMLSPRYYPFCIPDIEDFVNQ